MAEGEGFEPSVRITVRRLSRAVHSTTLPPFRGVDIQPLCHPSVVLCRKPEIILVIYQISRPTIKKFFLGFAAFNKLL